MGFWSRLWHRLLFGPSPLTQPPRPAARPAAHPGLARPPLASARPPLASAADIEEMAFTIREYIKPRPPRFVARSRQEVELALLLAWLPETERRRFLDLLVPRAGKQPPWTLDDVEEDLWEQVHRWQEPLVITEPETMTREGFSTLLGTQIKSGLYTYCTPLEVLSRPVRMLWLLRQGRLVGQVYAAMEQALGSPAQALDAAWWVVAGL
ncbi:MAG TPA: hypothetical protein VFU32_03605 [Ktedonobacterales bacterium]|nr:hypothetical protein [Ktedonobacterales bacterium]